MRLFLPVDPCILHLLHGHVEDKGKQTRGQVTALYNPLVTSGVEARSSP